MVTLSTPTSEIASPATFADGAHPALVDVETGHVEMVRYLVVEDCGRMVNPMVGEGQVQPLAATFMDDPLPAPPALPAMEVLHIARLPPATFGRCKAMTEAVTIGATSTVANALALL